MASGNVMRAESLMRMSGAMKSFHAARKANSPTVMRPGFTAGTSTRHSTVHEVHPSTMAASSSSRGMDSNEIRIMKVENGNWNMVSTSATPTSEFESPTMFSSTYSGMSRV